MMDLEDGCLLRIAMVARMEDGNQDGGMTDGSDFHCKMMHRDMLVS